ncbi:MAG: hypothetical protein ACTHPS_28875 [Streptosporangiaceae bacterium]
MLAKKKMRKAQAKLAKTERAILRDERDERDIADKPWYLQRNGRNAIRAAVRRARS